jgi:hypothetical protein
MRGTRRRLQGYPVVIGHHAAASGVVEEQGLAGDLFPASIAAAG